MSLHSSAKLAQLEARLDGLVALFLKEHDALRELTMNYGLF